VNTVVRSSPFLLLTTALTLSAFSMYAVLTNLIPLLTSRGASSSIAAWALGLGGIGQVAGRLGYGTLTRRTTVRTRTVIILLGSAATTTALAVLSATLGGYPALYIALAATAALAAAAATGGVPRR
jgi:predicted MFS family arabinose efflux permease